MTDRDLAIKVVKAAWRESRENFRRTVGQSDGGEYTLRTEGESFSWVGTDLEMIVSCYFTHDGYGGGGGFIVAHAVYNGDLGTMVLTSVYENFDSEPLYNVPVYNRELG